MKNLLAFDNSPAQRVMGLAVTALKPCWSRKNLEYSEFVRGISVLSGYIDNLAAGALVKVIRLVEEAWNINPLYNFLAVPTGS